MDDSLNAVGNAFYEWESSTTETLRKSLAGIRVSEKMLTSLVEKEFRYSALFQQQINAVTDALLNDGSMSRDIVDSPIGLTNMLTRPVKVSPEFRRAAIYNFTRPVTMLRTQIQAALRAIIRLLRGADLALVENNFHAAFVCYRSCIEQVGHLANLAKELSSVNVPTSFDESCKMLGTTSEIISKKLYATRVSWLSFANNEEVDRLIRKGSVEYKTQPDRINLDAQSSMKGVDLLNKKMKGVRSVYDVLCEFAHPNVGNLILSTVESSPREDSGGVCWIDKRLARTGLPVFFEKTPRLAEWIFEVVDFVLQELRTRLIPEVEMLEQKVLIAAQLFTKEMVSRHRGLIDPYASCPCGVGKKLRFCCGKG
jgi:hypothetical protein